MIIPSIDIMDGRAVQLVGGEKKALDAGDPFPIAERFSVAGEIAVIDLDAAMGKGWNKDLIKKLVRKYRCRVGGGIRTHEAAVEWLDAGAARIIIGTAASPEFLAGLPRERVMAALDARHGEVVVEGWKKGTGRGIMEGIDALRAHVGGFLVTFVETEGRMQGFDRALAASVIKRAGGARVVIAGGVTTAEDVAFLHAAGADAQVGMSLYTGKMELADAIISPIADKGPLWPTVVADEHGQALGLAWSDLESVREAVRTLGGVYHSRKRGLWRKGGTSGASQTLLRIDLDCDSDALRFTVRQKGAGFCHNGTWTCWGDDSALPAIEKRLKSRLSDAPAGSYTKRLFGDPALLRAKITEEAGELAAASESGSREEIIGEAGDVIFFTLAAMIKAGVSLEEVERELYMRTLKLTRRPGNAKPPRSTEKA